MNTDETWLATVAGKVTEQQDRAEDIIAQAAASADKMRSEAQAIAERAAAAENPDLAAAWAALAAAAEAMAEGSSSLARIMTGLRNWVAATGVDIAVTQSDVAAADADACRRIAEIRAAGGRDQDAAAAEILGETRAANGARIAGLRDWIPIPRRP
ncbi:hypothetical protein [Mycolicibacterium goodii]|uniref:Uncharacterized protein n=1 Tax=Mycolicibacterium goodii TaxID=134601 RepID=A0ABS6HGL7_MYCGD|nr:hypothetical protein [Mycolicibacterium goodii]MBU8821486.1 hypothetical protein [Mycolicibacterium goodii]MBU8836190.1 hypothetical protein [Mycolicibacterium goodii]